MDDSIRVLYVDDDPTSLRIRSELIGEHTRIEVVTESTVSAGLARLSTADVDCVLSDVDMPDRDGLDFLERVRDRDPYLPFILFSSNPSAELVDEAFEADATDCVPKSICTISHQLLAHRIVNAVEHYRRGRRLERDDER